jgi:ribonuclease H / adenosylcobalamin/alpha-ribazole phosphatase
MTSPTRETDIASLPGALAHPVLLVRHAPTSWTGVRWCGRADPPLTAAGRRVAAETARRLLPMLDAGTTILASPARRTRATAEAIGTIHGLPIAFDDDLLEVDVGVVEGRSWSEVELAFPDLATRIAAGEWVEWPGGEARTAVQERAARAAERIRAEATRGTVVVVSHGGLLHALARDLAGSAGDGRPIPPFAAGGIVRIDPAPAT